MLHNCLPAYLSARLGTLLVSTYIRAATSVHRITDVSGMLQTANCTPASDLQVSLRGRPPEVVKVNR